MDREFNIYVGTVGLGAWRSPDGGVNWERCRTGLSAESRVFALAAWPDRPSTIYAGSDEGIHISEDSGGKWERLDFPMQGAHVWSIAIDPQDPDTIFAGTRPSAFFRSRDGGRRWEKLEAELADTCPVVDIPRVISMVVDPSDHRTVWAGIQVDGVHRSLDGGDTWTNLSARLPEPDIHWMAAGARPQRLVIAGAGRAIFQTSDLGETWDTIPAERFPPALLPRRRYQARRYQGPLCGPW